MLSPEALFFPKRALWQGVGTLQPTMNGNSDSFREKNQGQIILHFRPGVLPLIDCIGHKLFSRGSKRNEQGEM